MKKKQLYFNIYDNGGVLVKELLYKLLLKEPQECDIQEKTSLLIDESGRLTINGKWQRKSKKF